MKLSHNTGTVRQTWLLISNSAVVTVNSLFAHIYLDIKTSKSTVAGNSFVKQLIAHNQNDAEGKDCSDSCYCRAECSLSGATSQCTTSTSAIQVSVRAS
jgi:hypothetical protein